MISLQQFTCLYWKLNKDNVCVTVAKVAAAAAAAARASRSLQVPGWLHRPGVDSEEARRLQRKIHSRVTIYQYFHDLRISYESPESVTVSRADWAARLGGQAHHFVSAGLPWCQVSITLFFGLKKTLLN
jgi:hypothetical protein